MEDNSEYKIPLYNISGEIVDYSIVDKNDFTELMKGKWYKNTKGYASGSIFDFVGMMHLYLTEKYDIPKIDVIDHINNIRLDNRLSNLRSVNINQNAQNRSKISSIETTSKYIGVCKTKTDTKWRMSIRNHHDGKKITYFFDEELHAAYYYDLMAIEIHGTGAKINNVEKPENFVIPTKQSHNKYGTVTEKDGKFLAKISYKSKRIVVGYFNTEEEAKNACILRKDELLNNDKIEKELEIKNEKITRNNEGIAKIDILSKGLNYECLVDDDKWHMLKGFSWNIGTSYYVLRSSDNKSMHQFIFNSEEKTMIDHINGNKLDNRLINLRKTNSSLNSHNLQQTNGKYLGVYIRDDYTDGVIRYVGHITKDGKKYKKTFKNELDAATWRNEKAKELYGSYAKINEIEKE